MDESMCQNLSQNDNLADELIMKGFILKTETIAENLDNYISMINSKRTGKHGCFKTEIKK